ncbi:hypothetical protein GUITHDRAFT_154903 [Guillardia theta CCMP2712]|uniref:Uncharacterized protein n=1 Tax=Guillardia theta (strain CCMP2712) TaxID=905079 RepID=L1IPE1_GUITC|nr:hypothetical protein GUITHDRAFT_154903 [Guillardia theta CCMP2712]EKX37685.1 hypothetical protein GUITHDRAFT_154903 [Guillardia theta CCMP2712]|eukprot:XP_005824665.1 hypothetical protein GUITHDRAFT_154903 [Guillardia theta CCMP2712]
MKAKGWENLMEKDELSAKKVANVATSIATRMLLARRGVEIDKITNGLFRCPCPMVFQCTL